MAIGVQELKLAAQMQEWSVRIAACRSSGMSVRAWCSEHVNFRKKVPLN